MDAYGYGYPPQYPEVPPMEGDFPDHGDGYPDYYGVGTRKEGHGLTKRRSRSRIRSRTKAGRSRSASITSETRSRSRSKSRSRSRSKSRSRSRSGSQSRSRSGSPQKELKLKEPSFLDAFRVLYLTPSQTKKNTTKFLATKKKQDRIQELLKTDGLGSKKWLFYPRSMTSRSQDIEDNIPGTRDNCDQRIKIDADFFRKYKKRNAKIDYNAPVAKLKRWELILYKKFGFVQAV